MEAIRRSSIFLLTILLVSLIVSDYCSLTGLASSLVGREQLVAIEDNRVTVKTTSGLLKGIRQSTANGQDAILKFLSVPYAEAPIAELRFKRPQELRSQPTMEQEQVIDAGQFGKTCPQYRHLTQFISPLLNIDNEHQTSEDCLRLNIFVPGIVGSSITNDNNNNNNNIKLLEPNKLLPVIVWIPGEGFDFADARQFDGSNLASKTQSIVVTVQYRVGILGFLHAPELNITGNMGIYDQIMALKWVHKNIDKFGGDPDRVTLMGRFSGSMSISTMITAPQHEQLLKVNGRLLFQRVALLSGIAVEDWIIDSNQHDKVVQLQEAALSKEYCTKQQIKDGNCLIGLPIEQLMRISNYGWRLVQDNELIGQKSPIEAIKSGQYVSQLDAILFGETGMEGTLCMYRHALDLSTNYAQLLDEDKLTSQDLYNMIRDDSQTYFRYNTDKTNPIEMALGSLIESTSDNQMMITNGGGGGGGSDQQIEPWQQPKYLREKYLNACSAYMVKSHLNRFKRNLLANNQQLNNRMDSSKKPIEIYHYELRYKPTFSLAPDYIRIAAHGDDIPLIFGLVYNQPKGEINEADLLMTRKMISYIGNFVHGNQPLLAPTILSTNNQYQTSSVVNETTIVNSSSSSSISIDENENRDDLSVGSPLAINIKARSWANEGQLHHIELDEADQQELNIWRRRRRHHHDHHGQQQQQQYQRQSSSQSMGYSNNNNNELNDDVKSSTINADKSINIRLILLDNINQQQQQQQQQQESNQIFFQRRRQFFDGQHLQRSASIIQQQSQPIPSQQTNMTLINESSFVTMLLFGTCLVIFALVCACLGFCLIIFRGSLNLAKTREQQGSSIQAQHYVNSSASSNCNMCEESQGGSIDAVLGGAKGKDARAFNNVFAKLRNNQTPQSHHHNQQQQQQQQQQQSQTQHQHQLKPLDGQSCEQIEP